MINQKAHRIRLQISDLIDAKIELTLYMIRVGIKEADDEEKRDLLQTRVVTIERELYSLLADL